MEIWLLAGLIPLKSVERFPLGFRYLSDVNLIQINGQGN